MDEDLNLYFKFVSNFRTSNIIMRRQIIEGSLPALLRKTKSVRLKQAINRFLSENTEHAQSTAS